MLEEVACTNRTVHHTAATWRWGMRCLHSTGVYRRLTRKDVRYVQQAFLVAGSYAFDWVSVFQVVVGFQDGRMITPGMVEGTLSHIAFIELVLRLITSTPGMI